MKQEVLFIILNEYADWEGAFIAACLNMGVMPGSEVMYTPKVVAPTLDAVRSIGGFRTLPDYSFQTMPRMLYNVEKSLAPSAMPPLSWQSTASLIT